MEAEPAAWLAKGGPQRVPPNDPGGGDLSRLQDDLAATEDLSEATLEPERHGRIEVVAHAPAAPDPTETLGPAVEQVRRGMLTAQQSLEAARREALSSSERELVRLAVAIAERVVGREIKGDPSLVAGWAREGLEALTADDSVRVHVSTRVARALKELEDWFGAGPTPEIVVDDRLADDACEVRGRWGRVDAGVRARLDAVVAALAIPDDDGDASNDVSSDGIGST